MITRRSVLCGLLAAPIVVRAGLIMPVKTPEWVVDWGSNAALGVYNNEALVFRCREFVYAEYIKPQIGWLTDVTEWREVFA